MEYINPSLLFPKQPTLTELDATALRKARMMWLAEFELNGNLPLTLEGREVSREQVLAVLDQLADPELAGFHQLVVEDPLLQRFLVEKTNSEQMLHKKEHYGSLAFFGFLEPFLVPAFREAFLRAVKDKDERAVHWLNTLRQHFPDMGQARVYNPANNHLLSQLEGFRQQPNAVDLQEEINLQEWTPYMSKVTANLLKSLPPYFFPVLDDWSKEMADQGAMLVSVKPTIKPKIKEVFKRALFIAPSQAAKHYIHTTWNTVDKLGSNAPTPFRTVVFRWFPYVALIVLISTFIHQWISAEEEPVVTTIIRSKPNLHTPESLFGLLKNHSDSALSAKELFSNGPPQRYPFMELNSVTSNGGDPDAAIRLDNQTNWFAVVFLSSHKTALELGRQGAISANSNNGFLLTGCKTAYPDTSIVFSHLPPGVYKLTAYVGLGWRKGHKPRLIGLNTDYQDLGPDYKPGEFVMVRGLIDCNEWMDLHLIPPADGQSAWKIPSYNVTLTDEGNKLQLKVEPGEMKAVEPTVPAT